MTGVHGATRTVTLNAMTTVARKLLSEALALPEDERLELASAIVASVHGPLDDGWDDAWLVELERRDQTATDAVPPASDWADARSRSLSRLGPR